MKNLMKKFFKNSASNCLVMISLFCVGASFAAPPTKLPPKKPKNYSEKELGESDAVKEVERITQESTASTVTSGAVAPVVISGGATASLVQKKKEEEQKKKQAETASTTPSTEVLPVVEDQPVNETPQSRLWLVLNKKPELGFTSGWVFTRKELSTLVGDGFSYGFLAAQELQPFIQLQLRVSGSHHRESNTARKSSLNLFPMEFLVQFSKEYGSFRFYVQPGLGSALWYSKSERLVDGYKQEAHGYDFMASGGLGAQYIVPDQPWRFGADASLSYVSGYFDNYFTRVLVYTSYQF